MHKVACAGIKEMQKSRITGTHSVGINTVLYDLRFTATANSMQLLLLH